MAIDYLAVSIWLAQGATEYVGGEILKQQLTDLGIIETTEIVISGYIEDAVIRLSAFIHQEFLQDNLTDALADLNDATNQFSLYMASNRTSVDRLVNATALASSVASHLVSVGLPAFDAYLMTVGLQLAIQEERARKFGMKEDLVTITLVNDIALVRVNTWKDEWRKLLKNSWKLYSDPPFSPDGKPDRWIIEGDEYGKHVKKTYHSSWEGSVALMESQGAAERSLERGHFEKVDQCTDKWSQLSRELYDRWFPF